MSTRPKLTRAQRLLLMDIAALQPKHVSTYYRPRKTLERLGLIEQRGLAGWWSLTEAGRALAAQVRVVHFVTTRDP